LVKVKRKSKYNLTRRLDREKTINSAPALGRGQDFFGPAISEPTISEPKILSFYALDVCISLRSVICCCWVG